MSGDIVTSLCLYSAHHKYYASIFSKDGLNTRRCLTLNHIKSTSYTNKYWQGKSHRVFLKIMDKIEDIYNQMSVKAFECYYVVFYTHTHKRKKKQTNKNTLLNLA